MPASKIAVIETRLPYTDRRALSEAWFSALHLASETRPNTNADARVRASATVPDAAHRSRASHGNDRLDVALPRRERASAVDRAARRAAYAGLDAPSRRANDSVSHASRGSFERARSYPPFRTSLTLDGANGTRVHLIVRRVGPTLHVVALCPPAAEQFVRKALTSAGIHFRARGERLQVDVNASGISA